MTKLTDWLLQDLTLQTHPIPSGDPLLAPARFKAGASLLTALALVGGDVLVDMDRI